MRSSVVGAILAGATVLLLAVPAAGAAPPTTKADAKTSVYNLIEESRPMCPIVKWRFYKVVQGTFRGISHPGRGKLLWKVTAEIEWAGSMFLHHPSWTVVGTKALPADMNPLTSVVYRDDEAAWIGKGCPGDPPWA